MPQKQKQQQNQLLNNSNNNNNKQAPTDRVSDMLQMHPYQFLQQLNTIFGQCNRTSKKSYSSVSRIKLPWKQFSMINIPAYFKEHYDQSIKYAENRGNYHHVKDEDEENYERFWKEHYQMIGKFQHNLGMERDQQRRRKKARPYTAQLGHKQANTNENAEKCCKQQQPILKSSNFQYTRSPLGQISNNIFLKRIINKGANLSYDKNKLKQQVLQKLKNINQQLKTSNNNKPRPSTKNSTVTIKNKLPRQSNNNNNKKTTNIITNKSKNQHRILHSAKSSKSFRYLQHRTQNNIQESRRVTLKTIKNIKNSNNNKNNRNNRKSRNSRQEVSDVHYDMHGLHDGNQLRYIESYEENVQKEVKKDDYLRYMSSEEILADYREKIKRVDYSISDLNVKKTISLLKNLQSVADTLE